MDVDANHDEKSVGVILVTHSDYGASLLKAAVMILGPQNNCSTISVDGSQEVAETVNNLKDAVARHDQGLGVIILTDMFGGTPTNLSLSLLGAGDLEVVTGVNLPMLLRVLGGRTVALTDLANDAKDAGLKGIVVAGEVLRSKIKPNEGK